MLESGDCHKCDNPGVSLADGTELSVKTIYYATVSMLVWLQMRAASSPL